MAISYSKFSTWKKCGAQYRYRYILKLPEPEKSYAMSRGSMLHSSIEAYLKKELDKLPSEIDFYTQFLTMLRDMEPVPEWKFALTEDWGPTDWEDENKFAHGVVDLKIVLPKKLHLYEWKTGKEYKEHLDQGWFYGLASLIHHPEAEEATVTRVYLDLKKNREVTYHQHMVKTDIYLWKDRLRRMDDPGSHTPNPGYYCRFCPFSKFNGGPCEF